MPNKKIAFVVSDVESAKNAFDRLVKKYGQADFDAADVIVALGGDGLMLETLHSCIGKDIPVYGMNQGTVGFLMNNYGEDSLIERIEKAHKVILHPLRMLAYTKEGNEFEALAINEVSTFRQTMQTASLQVKVDGKVRVEDLRCDGLLLSTPAGSTAYNLSVHGPILPMGSGVLALTPISAFRPRRWRGAILKQTSKVEITVLDCEKRSVSAVADNFEVRNISRLNIFEDTSVSIPILFDEDNSFEEKVLKEQFLS
ncbi:MAG: NAD kinase [Alphaproteobacteria bacterium]|nr:NAD kinase [Alphaproteobacteria bacterium]